MMEERHLTSVNRSERTVSHDPERTTVVPRFDDREIERARPAVPLDDLRGGGPLRSRGSRPLLAAAVVAGLAGGVLGGVGTALYQRRASTQHQSTTQSAPVAREAARPDDARPQQQADEGSAPSETQKVAAAVADGSVEAQPAAADSLEKPSQEEAEAEGEPAGAETEAELRRALDEWVDATNARDIDRQMSLYDSRLGAFYLARGASREAVRAEKRRVFARASAVDVRASGPTVRLGPDGRTAVMRFRKRYAIEGAGVERRGEVVQELRWRRTPRGWKIVSERDLRVVN